MEKLFKNIHWFIIGYALYLNAMFVYDIEEKLKLVSDQQVEVEKELGKQKKIKKQIIEYAKEIDDIKSKIEKVAQEIERNQQLLPSEINDSENLTQIRTLAEDVNIKEMSIGPDRDDERGFYIARRYRFKARATYLQFLILMEKISENKKILNITDMVFRKLDQPQRSKFQLIDGEFSFEAYKYNTKFKEDRGFDNIEKSFQEKKPEATKKPKRARSEAAKEE